MSDDVKFIFKTLIKVPCIIVISYLMFNIIMFVNFYFKGLGASYLVMQTVAANNYLPETEKQQMINVAKEFNESDLIRKVAFGCRTTSTSDEDLQHQIRSNSDAIQIDSNSTVKNQYGKSIKCYFAYEFIWQMPLSNKGLKVDGINNSSSGGMEAGLSQEGLVTQSDNGDTGAVVIFSYTVPGLKYYPDME